MFAATLQATACKLGCRRVFSRGAVDPRNKMRRCAQLESMAGRTDAMARCAHGADMKTAASRGSQNRPRVRDLALAGESIDMPLSRRARLLGASALAGGALRSLAIAAAGLAATTAMLAPVPAAAQFVCGGSATGAEPQTGAGAGATGIGAVACGPRANADGNPPTAAGHGRPPTGGKPAAAGARAHRDG